MLRGLTILNPVESRNQRIRLPDMDKMGIGAPSTIWNINLMEFTLTIQTKIMMNGLNKRGGREKPKKSAGTSVQGMVKNQLEKWRCQKPHSVLPDSVFTLH